MWSTKISGLTAYGKGIFPSILHAILVTMGTLSAMSTASSSIYSELFNDHDMEGDDPVIAMGSQDMKATSAVGARNLVHPDGNPRVVGYCAACYRLSGLSINFTNEEKMRYHMKAK